MLTFILVMFGVFFKQEYIFKVEGPPGEIFLGKTSELGEEGL